MSQGTVVSICISPAAGRPMQMLQHVEAIAGAGLKGDRYAAGEGSFNKKTGIGNRQITLINARFFAGTSFEFLESRRNIAVNGVELMWLIGREFKIGDARMRGVKYCDPCMRPSKLANKTEAFMDAFQDCGGLVAEVLESGIIRLQSSVIIPNKGY
jgi:MOSC domain-containing protein YiiM